MLLPMAATYPFKLYATSNYRSSYLKITTAFLCWSALAIALVVCQQAPVDVLNPFCLLLLASMVLPIATVSFFYDSLRSSNRSVGPLVWRSVAEVAIALPLWVVFVDDYLQPIMEDWLLPSRII